MGWGFVASPFVFAQGGRSLFSLVRAFYPPATQARVGGGGGGGG